MRRLEARRLRMHQLRVSEEGEDEHGPVAARHDFVSTYLKVSVGVGVVPVQARACKSVETCVECC